MRVIPKPCLDPARTLSLQGAKATRQSGDRFGYSIASSQNPAQRPGLDCHALTGSQ
ncbi:MAG: hypothetical protein O3B25_08595 [Verrucomicrobia bacterium]|nr:hypothetical protein [Verrucomicrobiota bacterium]